uniref:Actin maturation protease n=1 Tax=Parascaris univalens TaxID=6257 RepID=A0A915ARV2_PARUN
MAPILSALVEIRVDRLLEQLSTEESQCGAIAFLRDVGSILQNGPQCGLVALQMAAASFGLPSVDVQHIHRLAKERGFTNRGEMFSGELLV